MPNYRRAWSPGGTYFFTVNLLERRENDLLVRHINDWPHSTFHHLVGKGIYPLDWAGGNEELVNYLD